MRYVALLAVIAIIGYAYSKRATSNTSVDQAMSEFDQTVESTPYPQTTAAATAPTAPKPPSTQPAPSSGLRAPLDRTRGVMNQVKQRNGDGEF